MSIFYYKMLVHCCPSFNSQRLKSESPLSPLNFLAKLLLLLCLHENHKDKINQKKKGLKLMLWFVLSCHKSSCQSMECSDGTKDENKQQVVNVLDSFGSFLAQLYCTDFSKCCHTRIRSFKNVLLLEDTTRT